jgi:hypothetical protein
MKFEHNLEFETTEEINETFRGGNKELSDLIVDIALKNLKTKKKQIPVVSITANDDDLIYEVMIDREDLLETLETNLETMEEYEDYERCQKIADGVNYLKNKK